MKNYKIFVSEKIKKFLDKKGKKLKKRVKTEFKKLEKKPFYFGKPFIGIPYLVLRIGDYRAIFKVKKKEKRVYVGFIEHRKKVYNRFDEDLFF